MKNDATDVGHRVVLLPQINRAEKLRTKRFGAGILQGALFVIQVCNLHQKYSILDNGDFSGPGKIEISETLTAVVLYNANCTVTQVQSTIAM